MKKEREKDPYLLRNERKEGGERVKRRGWRKGGGGR